MIFGITGISFGTHTNQNSTFHWVPSLKCKVGLTRIWPEKANLKSRSTVKLEVIGPKAIYI